MERTYFFDNILPISRLKNIMRKRDSTDSYFFSNIDLCKLFIPLMIEQTLEFIIGISDSIMVSSVSEAAVSGVSLVDYVIQLLIFLFNALATGGAVVAGQYLGSKNLKSAREASKETIKLLFFVSLLAMVLCYSVKSLILYGIFGSISAEVREHALIYLNVVFASIPFISLYAAGASIFRTQGNSKLPMQISLLAGFLNVLGNAILIYGMKLGTLGAAIPTLVSRILAAFIILYCLTNTKNVLYISKNLKDNFFTSFDMAMVKRIASIGVPFGAENTIFQLGRIAVLSIVATFGTAAIAANSIGGTIAVFEVMPGMAINLGATTIISRCVGANDYAQARYYNKKIIFIVYALTIIINIITFFSMPLILKVYNLSEITGLLTSRIIFWHAVFAILIWPLAYTQPVTLRASGDAKFPMIVNIASMLICRIILAYILGIYFHIGVLGVWFAMFADWIIKAFLFIFRYLSGKWMKYKTI